MNTAFLRFIKSKNGDLSLTGVAFVLAGWGLWSLDPIVVFLIGPGVPRLLLAAAGTLAAGVVLSVPAAGVFRRLGTVPRRQLVLLVVLAVCFSALPQVCYLSAVTMMNPGMVSVILRSQIAFAVLWAVLFMHERMNRVCGLGVLMIVAANAWLMAQALRAGGGGALAGWMLAFTGALLWSGGTIFSKILLETFGPLELTALRTLVAGLSLTAVFVMTGTSADVGAVSGRQWLLILLEGVVTSGCGFALYFAGLKRVPVYVASSLEPVAPLYTLLIAVFVLKQAVDARDVLGTVLLLSGAVVVVAGGFRPRRIPPAR